MLALTRKTKESVFCLLPNGEQIEICIAAVIGSKVRLGLKAPPEVRILRAELMPETPPKTEPSAA